VPVHGPEVTGVHERTRCGNMERKRVPCSKEMSRDLRTVYATAEERDGANFGHVRSTSRRVMFRQEVRQTTVRGRDNGLLFPGATIQRQAGRPSAHLSLSLATAGGGVDRPARQALLVPPGAASVTTLVTISGKGGARFGMGGSFSSGGCAPGRLGGPTWPGQNLPGCLQAMLNLTPANSRRTPVRAARARVYLLAGPCLAHLHRPVVAGAG
jgi:hypothetical protein